MAIAYGNSFDQHDSGFLREQKMVAPTYQELTADQVLGFGEYYSLRDDPGNGMAMGWQ